MNKNLRRVRKAARVLNRDCLPGSRTKTNPDPHAKLRKYAAWLAVKAAAYDGGRIPEHLAEFVRGLRLGLTPEQAAAQAWPQKNAAQQILMVRCLGRFAARRS